MANVCKNRPIGYECMLQQIERLKVQVYTITPYIAKARVCYKILNTV